MKYMTFNSSCAFAGVANLLELEGIDVSDRKIAMGMKLPYLFVETPEGYLGGTMLQSARWFNLWLPTLGYAMREELLDREAVPDALRSRGPAMLGLCLTSRDKHAVVFRSMEGDRFCFINNKWQHTEEPECLVLEKQELMERLENRVMLARLEKTTVCEAEFGPLLIQSADTMGSLRWEIQTFCGQEQTPQAIMGAMNRLFRPILLDGITMLEFIDRREIADRLRLIQGQLMSIVKAGVPVVPESVMDVTTLAHIMVAYAYLIEEERVRLERRKNL